MKAMMVLPVLILALLSFSDALIIHYTEDHQNQTQPTEQEGYINCTCGGMKKSEELPKNSLEQVFMSIRNRNFCGDNNASPICDLLKECESCVAEIQKCTKVDNTSEFYDCFKKRFIREENHYSNANGTLTGKDRVARQIPFCSYPTNLKTADLNCVKYPSSVKCKQKCIFGHTLKEGISRDMKCKYSENIWKPIGFEECRPFVDCTMSLVSTGRLECATGTTRTAPTCNVTCERYEDKAATPKRTYECKITGTWSVKLPFCALPGSGLELVVAPRIKLHTLKKV